MSENTPPPEWLPSEAAIRQDMAIAYLCDNIMQGRDPFAGFPKHEPDTRFRLHKSWLSPLNGEN